MTYKIGDKTVEYKGTVAGLHCYRETESGLEHYLVNMLPEATKAKTKAD